MKVMIVVTHLLGTGHLTRALTLAKAFRKAGHPVRLVSGGLSVDHLRFEDVEHVQLPPLRSDGVDFTRLLDLNGSVASTQTLEQRKQLLCETLDEFAPDALITELFPFGRRVLKEEFQTLLRAAKAMPAPPSVFASIRDILAPPSKPSKADFAEATLSAFYDAVLVHSDPAIAPLSLSWPVSAPLEAMLRYTGFVAPPAAAPHPDRIGAGEIIVTAGGGSVGDALFDCARQAAFDTPDQTWRILVGGRDAAPRIERLLRQASANLQVEAARPEFRQMLHHARASVSMCGYNTALDLLQSPCPGVFVPFDEGSEVEQMIRAKALAEQRGFGLVTSANLSPAGLISAVDACVAEGRATNSAVNFEGAATAVDIVEQYIGARHEG
ncbi:Glycosyltransferase family 28 C-terminal domain [Sulfitobacter noctilucicola]|nr:Glycosyltransferase family 28 C-terminal domain [Sulfitobacter noctilucicola]